MKDRHASKSWRRKMRKRLAARDGLKCWWCKKELTLQTATIEHLTPKSEGGQNEMKNLRLACYPCNIERNQRLK